MNSGFEIFEGLGTTLEAALEAAHRQIPPRDGRDFTTSRVLEWGMQYGGFVGEKVIYVKVVEDANADFKTKT